VTPLPATGYGGLRVAVYLLARGAIQNDSRQSNEINGFTEFHAIFFCFDPCHTSGKEHALT
jgi:hypothetical protein